MSAFVLIARSVSIVVGGFVGTVAVLALVPQPFGVILAFGTLIALNVTRPIGRAGL